MASGKSEPEPKVASGKQSSECLGERPSPPPPNSSFGSTMSLSGPVISANEITRPAARPDSKGLAPARSGPQTPLDPAGVLNPPHRRRLLILLSFPLIFLLGVPFWWWSTSIQRLGLPVDRIAALESAPPTTVRSTILLTASPDAYPPPPEGLPLYSPKEVCEALGDAVIKSTDGYYRQGGRLGTRWWDMVYEGSGRDTPALHIHILNTETASPDFPLRPYVQTPHLGLGSIPGPGGSPSGVKAGTVVVPIHPKQIKDRYLREHLKLAITDAILGLYPSQPPEIPLRAIKYSPNVTLSFVLLNEDAAEGGYVQGWDIEAAIREHFTPHLEALRPVFNFTIESQVLYHAPLSFEPVWGDISPPGRTAQLQLEAALSEAERGDQDAEEVAKSLIEDEKREKAWLIDEEMMKVFVNSERWTLGEFASVETLDAKLMNSDSGISQNPVLRFLLFIPSASHRPLLLATPSSSPPSFLLPQFGSVVILNPPSTASSPTFHLVPPALKASFHLFTSHLYSLLALPSSPPKVYPCPPADTRVQPSGLRDGFNRWQLESVARQRMRENEDEARKTLSGIGRLVEKINEMQVGEAVRDRVLGAVERLEKMSSTKDPLEAFVLSRDAVALANEAFFHHSMMGLLYFPNEHKFAVYMPLFGPIALPMILGILKEIAGWVRRRKARRRARAVEVEVDSAETKVDLPDVGKAEKPGEGESHAAENENAPGAEDEVVRAAPLSTRVLRARTPRQKTQEP